MMEKNVSEEKIKGYVQALEICSRVEADELPLRMRTWSLPFCRE
jgi:hypothetical protein